MKHKQKQGFGCGLYAIANACNLEDFVTEERLKISKEHGNNMGQLQAWLRDDNVNVYPSCLYYNHFGKNLPRDILCLRSSSSSAWIPIVIHTRQEGDKNHLVGGHLGHDGKLHLMDSLKQKEVETTLAKVNKLYDYVYGLHVFSDVESGDFCFIGSTE